jgi:hypothetical protein
MATLFIAWHVTVPRKTRGRFELFRVAVMEAPTLAYCSKKSNGQENPGLEKRVDINVGAADHRAEALHFENALPIRF